MRKPRSIARTANPGSLGQTADVLRALLGPGHFYVASRVRAQEAQYPRARGQGTPSHRRAERSIS